MSTTVESLLCKEIESDRGMFLLAEEARGGEDRRGLSFLVVGGVSLRWDIFCDRGRTVEPVGVSVNTNTSAASSSELHPPSQQRSQQQRSQPMQVAPPSSFVSPSADPLPRSLRAGVSFISATATASDGGVTTTWDAGGRTLFAPATAPASTVSLPVVHFLPPVEAE